MPSLIQRNMCLLLWLRIHILDSFDHRYTRACYQQHNSKERVDWDGVISYLTWEQRRNPLAVSSQKLLYVMKPATTHFRNSYLPIHYPLERLIARGKTLQSSDYGPTRKTRRMRAIWMIELSTRCVFPF